VIGTLIKVKDSSIIREKISGKYGIIMGQIDVEGSLLYIIMLHCGTKIHLSEHWIEDCWRYDSE